MTKRKPPSSPGGDYAVGYGRPPERTRFQTGRSGNPKGRPKGSRSIGAILQDMLRQKISVTENGRTRRLTAVEVIFLRLKNDALRGDPKAIKSILSLVERYGEASDASLPLDAILAEDKEILAQFLGQPNEGPVDATGGSDSGGDDDPAD